MNILLLVPDLRGPGGVNNYYNALNLPGFVKARHFFVNTQTPQSKWIKPFRLVWNFIKFTLQLIFIKTDLVHVNPSLDFNSFFRDGMFILISRCFGKKILVFFRGWEDPFENKIKQSKFLTLFFHSTYKKAHRYIVLSQGFKSKLLSLGIPGNTPFHIETTVADSSQTDLINWKFREQTFNTDITCLFMSRIEKEKGILIAMDAVRKLKEKLKDRNISLLIAGDGSFKKEAEDYAKKNKLDFCRFIGHVSGEKKFRLLLDSHIFLFPTYYGEGMPNNILEGMVYGMPVFSRFVGGIGDVAENGKNGFVTNSKEPEDFANAMYELIKQKQRFFEIARLNHQTGVDKFSAGKVRTRILNIYESIEKEGKNH